MEQLEDESFPRLIPLQDSTGSPFPAFRGCWEFPACNSLMEIGILRCLRRYREQRKTREKSLSHLQNSRGQRAGSQKSWEKQICRCVATQPRWIWDLGFGTQQENPELPPLLLFSVLRSQILALGNRTNFPTIPIKRFPSEPLIRTF